MGLSLQWAFNLLLSIPLAGKASKKSDRSTIPSENEFS